MSPTTIFTTGLLLHAVRLVHRGLVQGVPGVWGLVGAGRGYTGYPPDRPRDPYLVISQAKGPTHGQMKAILRLNDEVSRMGLE